MFPPITSPNWNDTEAEMKMEQLGRHRFADSEDFGNDAIGQKVISQHLNRAPANMSLLPRVIRFIPRPDQPHCMNISLPNAPDGHTVN